MKLRPTLKQVFALSLLGLLLSLALLFYLVFANTQRTILQSAERFRDSASRQIIQQIARYLDEAPAAVAHFEKQMGFGLVDRRRPDSIQANLLSLLLADENLSEATLTYAEGTGFDPKGNIVLTMPSVGQIMVMRAGDGHRFLVSRTWLEGTNFVSETLALDGAAGELPTIVQAKHAAVDPTLHLTFRTPASKRFYGQLLWTDLHWSQIDEKVPEDRRRAEVSVQKTVEDAQGRFVGVVRVGLLKDRIDQLVHVRLDETRAEHAYQVFLCDSDGRLITGFEPSDPVTLFGNDLRVRSRNVPPPVAAALHLPALASIDRSHPAFAGSVRVGSRVYLCTLRALSDTQDWIVGIVVPRDYYLADLLRTQQHVLWTLLGLIVAIIAGGALLIHSINRAHTLVVEESARMNEFEFAPSTNASWLRDVQDVLAGLEKAKAAMRAMGKYVPVDLVRRLYHDCREPTLGAASVDLSVMFTDIKGFTDVAEQTAPAQLADRLGRYLQAATEVIQAERGTIDKFIGDAVMAFWNAPEPVTNHSVLACRAALKVRDRLEALYASPAWQEAPRFETRFGLHRCVASVGHFGAPNRFNYTAIGDGVNLASRLEGLNKFYGTAIIVSETIFASARREFAFRLLDRVAVKGKTQGITIYELVGERETTASRQPRIARYEQAFEAYQRRDFKAAVELLDGETQDQPSCVLVARCRTLLEDPPAPDWTGVHVLLTK